MKIIALFTRELRFRKTAFFLGVIAVAVASAGLVGSRAYLENHDDQTNKLIGDLQERSKERMAKMRDEARKFSLTLGFNTMLIPQGQSVEELYAEGRSSHFFSEEMVAAMVAADFHSLNHLRPVLRERASWPEMDISVILTGVRGVVFIKSPAWQKPLASGIDFDKAHIGRALAERLKLSLGDEIIFHGRKFTIGNILPYSGGEDDVSLRISLENAQEILERPGKISAVLAITCLNCDEADTSLPEKELHKVTPGAGVVTFHDITKARREARTQIGEVTKHEVQDIMDSRNAIREQIAVFAEILVAMLSLGAVVLLAILTFNNARERRAEVAMLRALGVKKVGIMALFLCKAVLIGLAGGVLGPLAGVVLARNLLGAGAGVPLGFILAVGAAAIITSVLASIAPAAAAARQDPAQILNQE